MNYMLMHEAITARVRAEEALKRPTPTMTAAHKGAELKTSLPAGSYLRHGEPMIME